MIVQLVLHVRAFCHSLHVIQSAAVAGYGKVHKVSETGSSSLVRVVDGSRGGYLPEKKAAGVCCEGKVANICIMRLTLKKGIPTSMIRAVIFAMIPTWLIHVDEIRIRYYNAKTTGYTTRDV